MCSAEGEHDELLAAVDVFEDSFSIFETKEPGYFRGREQHLPQFRCTEIGIDAAGNHDTAFSASPDQAEAALKKELIEIDLLSVSPSFNDRYLVLILRRLPEVVSLVVEPTQVCEPRGHRLWVIKTPSQL